MDLMSLKQFFTYVPVFEPQPQALVDEIKASAARYLPAKSLDVIQRTYEFAARAHGDGLRLSGEPYIVHPLKATLFLMALKPDLATLQTCILHDVIEDTDIPYEVIEKEFSTEVADLCEGMVKVSKIKYRGEERQIETLKKTFLAMGKDLRVIFVKIADRIHNIQTLHYHPKPEKQRRIAEETLQIYVPIAKRLGLNHYQQLLENGAFRILHPKEFTMIMNYLDKQLGNHDDLIQQGIAKLETLLTQHHVDFLSIKGRIKSPYRIWEKMQFKYKSMDFGNITDLIAFRVVTHSVGDCYNVLGFIHHSFTPVIKKIKDYIAVPKSNEYRSLHTTVLGVYDFPVEVQIRTKEMDEVADWGVAAHFAYAEGSGKKIVAATVGERQSLWIKKLQDLVSTYTEIDDKEAFKNELSIELLDRNIFIYTQKGDVIELPEGSTVLDFAFRIHSDLGLKFQHAMVNGAIVNIGHKLKTGDIVYIHVFKNKWSASGNWFEHLHTPSAKAKLTKFLKQQERDELINQSVLFLREKIKELGLPPLFTKRDRIGKEYKGEKFDRLMLQLLDKQMGYTTFLRKIYADIVPEESLQKVIKVAKKNDVLLTPSEVVIDGIKRIGYFLCPECKPDPHNKIIARSGKDGIKIHCTYCVAIATVDPGKLLEAHRGGEEITKYTCALTLHCADKPGVLLDVLHVFTSLGLNITNIQSGKTSRDIQHVSIVSDTSHPSKVHFLLQELKKLGSVVKVVKKSLS